MSVHVAVGPDADAVGRTVREQLDRGERAAAFVGDPDADRDALEEFLRDVIRDDGIVTTSAPVPRRSGSGCP